MRYDEIICNRCGKNISVEFFDLGGNCACCGDDLCAECAGGWNEYGECKRCQEHKAHKSKTTEENDGGKGMSKLAELQATYAQYEVALRSVKSMEPREYRAEYGDKGQYVSFRGGNDVEIVCGNFGIIFIPSKLISGLAKVLADLVDDGAASAEGGD
jgi:hypothetical protein